MHDKVKAFLRAAGVQNSDTILVAVSGGADSMCLLRILHGLDVRLAVAHCNYGLRGKDSDMDEAFVKQWCDEHSITFHSERFATNELAASSDSSIQMVARHLRYAYFEALMDSYGYAFTALGHHADDRIESLVLNLLRGTGIRGLHGMPSQRGRFIRPLLAFRKNELLKYVAKHTISYRDDTSNETAKYQRNRVRLQVIPTLRQLMPMAEDNLLRLAERVEQALPKIVNQLAKETLSVTDNYGKELRIDRNAICLHPYPFTLLREVLNPLGFSSEQVFELIHHPISSTGEMESPAHRLFIEPDRFIIIEKLKLNIFPTLSFETIEKEILSSLRTPSNVVLVDAENMAPSDLSIRKWRNGDRFRPFGMSGWKKLSDYFIDSKFTALQKERTWLLTKGDTIVWVVGHRMDDSYKVTEQTTQVLRITVDDLLPNQR